MVLASSRARGHKQIHSRSCQYSLMLIIKFNELSLPAWLRHPAKLGISPKPPPFFLMPGSPQLSTHMWLRAWPHGAAVCNISLLKILMCSFPENKQKNRQYSNTSLFDTDIKPSTVCVLVKVTSIQLRSKVRWVNVSFHIVTAKQSSAVTSYWIVSLAEELAWQCLHAQTGGSQGMDFLAPLHWLITTDEREPECCKDLIRRELTTRLKSSDFSDKNSGKNSVKIINSKRKTPLEYQFTYLNTFHSGTLLISHEDVEVNRETSSNYMAPPTWTYNNCHTNQKVLEILILRPLLKRNH